MAELWALGLVILATIIGSLGPLFLKKASGKIHRKLSSIVYNKQLMLGILFYGLSTVLFIPALKGGQLSVIYPVTSLTYIWVSLLSVKYLGEKMNWMRWTGVGLIIIGVSAIGLG